MNETYLGLESDKKYIGADLEKVRQLGLIKIAGTWHQRDKIVLRDGMRISFKSKNSQIDDKLMYIDLFNGG